jgi:hypothetical protein
MTAFEDEKTTVFYCFIFSVSLIILFKKSAYIFDLKKY